MGWKTTIRQWLHRRAENKRIQTYETIYGEFDKNDYSKYMLHNLPSESDFYWGELIHWSTALQPGCVLFVGENKDTAIILQKAIRVDKVLTAGLSDVDYKWNFEEQHPVIDHNIDLIVSQAIFEHLLNPYKHLKDLSELVAPQGFVLIHTVMPDFPYHRFPIDSLRFFPDWFEESGKRFQLKVIKKRIRDGHIFYLFQKKVA
jgi:hypothetical protein